MAKQNSLCDSRGLAKAIGWSHKEVLNYLDEEYIPYKTVSRGALFPANLIARDMWVAYKTDILTPSRSNLGGHGKKLPRKFRGTKKRATVRRKKRAKVRRFSRTKKSGLRRRKTAGRARTYGKKRFIKKSRKHARSKKGSFLRVKASRKGSKRKKGVAKKRRSTRRKFDLKRIFWFW